MIYRIDVRAAATPREGEAADPLGESIRHQIAELGANVGPITTRRVFLIDTDAPRDGITRVATELLTDPVVERADVIDRFTSTDDNGYSRIEVHLKPGVMDPVAQSTEMAIRDMGLAVREVRTGRAYLIEGKVPQAELERIASKVLANGVIESIHFSAFVPDRFPRGHEQPFTLRTVPVTKLSDEQLIRLSRDGHLFLSLDEMKAIQAHYRSLGREPTDAELETLAQTWSEHCIHKTLKSAVDLEIRDESGNVLEKRHYDNLIRDTIFRSTMELMEGGKRDFCLSVFADNAGVIAFDETDAVCFKVETHNRPSAIDPYGGSATGVGGVIRDVLGTGLGAAPIANTDVFCVADPNFGLPDPLLPTTNDKPQTTNVPKGVLHPKRILQQVVAGVRDYGNRMGIPTVNGAVYFDDRYLANPLVFCGCVGLIPRSMIKKAARPGDRIVVMGGRTGRDGIHGATFSSAELTTTHADEFSHAVQIGNAITEKKMTDVVLQARDRGLFTAITDCGAGGLSSAVGEMGEKLGAFVELDKVPLKYAGLKYDEIWISEAQERMVVAVPEEHVAELLALAAGEAVESTVIGHFGTERRELILTYKATEVARMAVDFVHKGLPMPRRKAVFVQGATKRRSDEATQGKGVGMLKELLLSSLSHPNIASKHWIIRQYDHEVQGGSVIKPLTGPLQIGPSDAAVLRPKLDSHRGVAIACGLCPQIEDPYDMAIAAIDEAVRNVVAVGADPSRTAILDNFCWPGTNDELSMGFLVRTCEACYDAARAFGIPFISGKDSLHNQFTDRETGCTIRIPNTLLISAISVLDDVRNCVTMDLKGGRGDTALCLVSPRDHSLPSLIATHRAVAETIRSNLVLSCHDVSDGGWLTAAAEMCIASGLGLSLERDPTGEESYFSESPARYLIEIDRQGLGVAASRFSSRRVGFRELGTVTPTPSLDIGHLDPSSRSRKYDCHVFIDDLAKAWRRTLDW